MSKKSVKDAIETAKLNRVLDLSGKELSIELPKAALKIANSLTDVNVSRNSFSEVPIMSEMRLVTEMNLSDNCLHVLDGDIFLLVGMRKLNLSRNYLDSLPENIASLNNLRSLDLSNNSLRSLPSDFSALIALEEIHLNGNKFAYLPVVISDCQNLRLISCNDNQMVKLVDTGFQFSNMNFLKTLSARNNRLSTVPKDLALVNTLEHLDLSGNRDTLMPQYRSFFSHEGPMVRQQLQECMKLLHSIESDPVVPVIEIPSKMRVSCKGHLSKQGGRKSGGVAQMSWKKRYFVLDGTRLKYFKNEKDPIPLGEVSLSTTNSVGVSRSTEKIFSFKISSPEQEMYLQAQTKEEYIHWVTALRTAEAHNGRNPPFFASGKDVGEKASDSSKSHEAELATKLKEANAVKRTDFHGYLTKLGSGLASHKKRFFVLSGLILRVYKDENSNGVLSEYNLKAAQIQTPAADVKEPFSFAVTTFVGKDEKPLVSCLADNEDQLSDWMKAFRKAIQADKRAAFQEKRRKQTMQAAFAVASFSSTTETKHKKRQRSKTEARGSQVMGWLAKKGQAEKSWKRRWAILDVQKQSLTLYKSETELDLILFQSNLEGVKISSLPEADIGKPNCLSIEYPNGSRFVAYADDQSSFTMWWEGISSASKKKEKKPDQPQIVPPTLSTEKKRPISMVNLPVLPPPPAFNPPDTVQAPNLSTSSKFRSSSMGTNAKSAQSGNSLLESKKRSMTRFAKGTDTVHSGWLHKKGGSKGSIVKTWKKRWFVLNNSNLKYYKDKNDPVALGELMIVDSEMSYPADDETGKAFSFSIKEKDSSRGIFFAFAQDRDDLQAWTRALKTVQESGDQSKIEAKKPKFTKDEKSLFLTKIMELESRLRAQEIIWDNKVKKLEKENERMSMSLQRKENTLSKLENENSSRQEESNSVVRNDSAFSSMKADLESKIVKLSSALEKERAESKGIQEDFSSKLYFAKKEKELLETRTQELEACNSIMQEGASQLESELTKMQSEYETLKNEAKEKIEGFSKEIKQLEKMKKQVEELKGEKSQICRKMEDLRDKEKKFESEIQERNAECMELRNKLDQIGDKSIDSSKLTDTLKALKKAQRELKNTALELETEQQEKALLDEELSLANETLNTVELEMEQQKLMNEDALIKERNEFKNKLDDLNQQRMAAIEAERAVKEELRQQLDKNRSAWSASDEGMQSRLRELEEGKVVLDVQVANLTRKLEHVTKQYEKEKSEHELLDSSMTELTKSKTVLSKEIELLTASTTKKDDQLSKLSQEYDMVISEKKEIMARVDALEKEIEEENSSKQEFMNELEQSHSKLEEAAKTIRITEEALKEKDEKIENLKRIQSESEAKTVELNSLKEQNETLSLKLETLKKNSSDTITKGTSEANTIKSHLKDAEAKNLSLNHKIALLENDIGDKTATNERISADIAEIREKFERAEDSLNLSTLEKTALQARLDSKIKDLDTQIKEKNEQLSEISAKMEEERENGDSLNRECKEQEQTIQILRNKAKLVEEYELQITKLTEQVDSSTSRMKGLELELGSKAETITTLNEETATKMDKMDKKIENLVAEIAEKQEMLNELDDSNKSLTQEVKQSISTTNSLKETIFDLENKSNTLEELLEKERQERQDSLQNTEGDLARVLSEKEKIVSDLRSELSDVINTKKSLIEKLEAREEANSRMQSELMDKEKLMNKVEKSFLESEKRCQAFEQEIEKANDVLNEVRKELKEQVELKKISEAESMEIVSAAKAAAKERLSTIKSLTTEIEELRTAHASATAELNSKSDLINEINSDKVHLEEKLGEKTASLSSLQEKSVVLLAENEQLKQLNSELDEKLDAITDISNNCKEENSKVVSELRNVKQELEEVTEKYKNTEKQNESMLEESARLNSEIEEAMTKLEETANQLEQHKTKQNELENSIEDMTRQHAKAQSKITEQMAIITKHQTETTILNDTLEKLKESDSVKSTEIAEMKERMTVEGKTEEQLKSLQEELKLSSEELSKNKEDLEQHFDELRQKNAAISLLEDEKEDFIQTVKNLEQKFEEANSRVVEMEIEKQSISDERDAIAREKQAIKDTSINLQKQLTDIQAQADTLKQIQGDGASELSDSMAKNSELEQVISILKKDLENKTLEVEECTRKANDTMEYFTKASKEASETEKTLNDKQKMFETEKKDLSEKLKEKRAESDELKLKIKKMTSQISDLNDRIESKETKESELKTREEDLQSQLKLAHARISDLAASGDKQNNELQSTQSELKVKENAISVLEKSLKEALGEKEGLKTNMSKLSDECDTLQKMNMQKIEEVSTKLLKLEKIESEKRALEEEMAKFKQESEKVANLKDQKITEMQQKLDSIDKKKGILKHVVFKPDGELLQYHMPDGFYSDEETEIKVPEIPHAKDMSSAESKMAEQIRAERKANQKAPVPDPVEESESELDEEEMEFRKQMTEQGQNAAKYEEESEDEDSDLDDDAWLAKLREEQRKKSMETGEDAVVEAEDSESDLDEEELEYRKTIQTTYETDSESDLDEEELEYRRKMGL